MAALPSILASEFAAIELLRDEAANGPRLRLVDLRTGASACFDPLELEALIRMPRAVLRDWTVPTDAAIAPQRGGAGVDW